MPVRSTTLVYMSEKGQGVPKDYKEAVEWYKKAAEQEYVDAQNNLGTMYAKGLGVPKDYIQAYAWFNLVASNRDIVAKKNRGIIEAKMTPEQIAKAQELSKTLVKKQAGNAKLSP